MTTIAEEQRRKVIAISAFELRLKQMASILYKPDDQRWEIFSHVPPEFESWISVQRVTVPAVAHALLHSYCLVYAQRYRKDMMDYLPPHELELSGEFNAYVSSRKRIVDEWDPVLSIINRWVTYAQNASPGSLFYERDFLTKLLILFKDHAYRKTRNPILNSHAIIGELFIESCVYVGPVTVL